MEKDLAGDHRPGSIEVLSTVLAAVDWFIPSSARDAGTDLLRRARLTVSFAMALMLMAVVFGTFHITVNSPICAMTFGIGVGAGLICLYAMRRTGSCFLTGNLLAVTVFGVLTVLTCRMGGHGSLVLPWYAVIPVVTLGTAGRRPAAVWIGIISGALFTFYGLDCYGYGFPDDLTPSQYELLNLMSMIALAVLVLALAFLYEGAKSQTLEELENTKAQLLLERDFSDSMIASLPGIFYLFNEEGALMRWNENFECVTGYSSEELPELGPLDFFREEDRAFIEKEIENVFTRGQSGTEAFIATKDGNAVPHLFSSRRITLDGRQHLVGTGLDITDRKRVEEALRASEERFRQFAMASGHGIAMSDLDGHVVFANAAVLRMLEEESERTFSSKTVFDHYLPEDVERVKKEIQPFLLASGRWVGELPLRTAKGNVIATEQSAFLIHDEQGVPRMIGNIITDITERKQTEAELARARDEAEAANQAKSEFLANMSHEIRTPMTAILGYSDILFESKMDREQLDAATTIRSNGEYLIQIINDILDLSKIEAGKLETERIPCSPCQILTDSVSLMRVRANAKNLPLELEFATPMSQSIQSDPIRLRQILINLIGNAIKFTEVGRVRVAARLLDTGSANPKLQVEVIDSGIGMPEEQTPQLFEPFSQIDSSTTRRHGGTGLGLAISKRLAERLGGDIAVRSVLGEGSTFTVTVTTGPLDGVEMLRAPSQVLRPSDSPETHGSSGALIDCRVLLAEDGPDNQRLITFLLKKAGVDVVVADNGQIAYDLALEARDEGASFDVILMDMQMPVMDGYEATSGLRKAGYTGPIIAVTAHAMSTDRDKCLRSGCDDYMAKPIDREQLLALVAQYTCQDEPAAPVR